MKALTKIKIKIFIIKLLFELIVNGIIITVSLLTESLKETLFFYISWIVFRNCVPKLFHVKLKTPLMSIVGCILLSTIIFICSTKLMLPLCISVFSSVFVGMIINYILYKLQDYIDIKKQIAEQTKSIYQMTETELRQYAQSKKISEQIVDTLVLKVIHNYKWVEIQKERNYTKRGIDYHKEVIRNKLNIDI